MQSDQPHHTGCAVEREYCRVQADRFVSTHSSTDLIEPSATLQPPEPHAAASTLLPSEPVPLHHPILDVPFLPFTLVLGCYPAHIGVPTERGEVPLGHAGVQQRGVERLERQSVPHGDGYSADDRFYLAAYADHEQFAAAGDDQW